MTEVFDPTDKMNHGRCKSYLPAQYFSNLGFALAYVGKDILTRGVTTNPRGMETKELLGRTFIVTDTRKRVVDIPARMINIFFLYGELIWYMKGVDDVHHITHYNKRMKSFSDDGDTLRSAYGRRLLGFDKSMHEFNQMQYVIRMLMEDPSSRKAIMHIRTVEDSMFHTSKDMPCTIAIQFFIRNEELIAMTTMRSNDLIFGATYDIPFFMFMQDRIAWELGVESGPYYHQAMSLHVYEMHYEMVVKMWDQIESGEACRSSFSIPEIGSWSKPMLDEVFRMEEMCRAVKTYVDVERMKDEIFENMKDLGWRHALQCCLLNSVGRICEKQELSSRSMNLAVPVVVELLNRMEPGIRILAAKQLESMVGKGPDRPLLEVARALQRAQI